MLVSVSVFVCVLSVSVFTCVCLRLSVYSFTSAQVREFNILKK